MLHRQCPCRRDGIRHYRYTEAEPRRPTARTSSARCGLADANKIPHLSEEFRASLARLAREAPQTTVTPRGVWTDGARMGVPPVSTISDTAGLVPLVRGLSLRFYLH